MFQKLANILTVCYYRCMGKRRAYGNVWYALRFRVLSRDNFTCMYCGARAPDVLLHVDHVIAVADGGSDELANLVSSCEACNLGKEHLRIQQVASIPRVLVHEAPQTLENKISAVLQNGSLHVGEIATIIASTPATVRVILSRHKNTFARLRDGTWSLVV